MAVTYTNSGLVEYCREALKLKTVYMWGGLFREVNKSYINMLSGIPEYKVQYPAARVDHLRSLIGKGYYGCDCVGLVKSYYFGGVGTANNAKGYVGAWDYGVGTMYNAAKVKGTIGTFPEHKGQLVMTKDFGHVGVYIGDGDVVECTLSSFGDGVVKTKLKARNWAWWCQCPIIVNDTGKSDEKISVYVDGVTNAPVNVRAAANIMGKIVTKLAAGTKVQLTGKTVYNGGYTWAEVLYEGKICYCDRKWINC